MLPQLVFPLDSLFSNTQVGSLAYHEVSVSHQLRSDLSQNGGHLYTTYVG